MYLSNRDIAWAIECGKLIVEPPPDPVKDGFDQTGIDLHLGRIDTAKVWDIEAYRKAATSRSAVEHRGELSLGGFDWESLARDYLIAVPEDDSQPVFCRGKDVVVKPFGFLLWATREKVGTPVIDPTKPLASQQKPELICFVNAKSTKARTGLLVHFTAPTIHSDWVGNITLEITNLGPFDFVLREGDAIAQLTVATISSAPDLRLRKSKQMTQGQIDPSGAPPRPPRSGKG
ncbi:MAG: hypothetical protein K2W96_02710 [Gemmataceae bacterium]|nr:hypothetical protein [Gemmataceae bacterium]